MRTLVWLPTAALVAAAAGCSTGPQAGEDTSRSSTKLINGTHVTGDDLAPTVKISGCTAAKVGPRHFMTAAHCVHTNATNTTRLGPGDLFQVTTDRDLGSGTTDWENLTVRSVDIAPTYVSDCGDPGPGCGNNAREADHPPDVAIVTVEECTSEIEEASISVEPLQPGDAVTITGYGCQEITPEPPPQLKSQLTYVATAQDAAVAEGDDLAYTTAVSQSYLFTPGPDMPGGTAGGCPGDSGAPVYLGDGSSRVIVGVHSTVGTIDYPNNPPYVNWASRLDTDARQDVSGWLQGLGVNIVGVPRMGDVNHDGTVNTTDAVMVAQYDRGMNPQPFDPDLADVNCDGSIDEAEDAILISQFYVGAICEFPCDTGGSFDACSCNPNKCSDCSSQVANCESTPGCLEIVECTYDAACSFPHENCGGQSCFQLTGYPQSSAAGQAANGVVSCMGGC